MNIGQIIRKYRKEMGLTQEEMANRLGVTTPAVNKWENGNSNPDIELLAPIARLLNISLDTLLSFREKLTPEEIAEIIQELDGIFDTDGYEKAYERAVEAVRKYPNCNMLIWQVAVVLDARRLTGDCNDSEKYDEQIHAWYERVLKDEDEEIRRHAADSLFGYYLRKKEYQRAEEYLHYFSDKDPMKKIYQGRLHKEQGENKEAYKIFEDVIFSQYQTLNFAFSMMTIMAIEEGDIKKARYLAGRNGEMARALEMGKYREYSPMLDVVYAEKNVTETYEIVKQLLNNCDSLYDFRQAELYQHRNFREPKGAFAENLKEKMLEGFRDEETFGYMKESADWKELISQ